MGTDNTNTPYFIKQNGEKVYYEHEKEKLLREIWEEVCSEEEEDEENENEERVREFLGQNLQRISPFTHADNNRLNEDNNFLTFDVTTGQIKNTIKHMKNTWPGNSGINKTILQKLPEEAIERVKHTYNASLSAGYFPDRFKLATIKFIPQKR